MKIVQLLLLFTLFLKCSGASSGGTSPIFGLLGGSSSGGISTSVSENATLKSIQIEPANVALAQDTSAEFTATAIYSDGSKVDVTSSVKWNTVDESMAEYYETTKTSNKSSNNSDLSNNTTESIIKKIKFKAKSPGKTKIKATLDGIYGEAEFLIKDAVITAIQTIPPSNLPKGTEAPLKAIAILSDNTKQDVTNSVNWTSNTPDVINTDSTAEKPVISSPNTGNITITASLNEISSTTTIKISEPKIKSISIEGIQSIVRGLITPFKALAIYDNGQSIDVTSQVTWTLEDDLAQINKDSIPGLLQGIGTGEVTLRASFQDLMVTRKVSITAPKIISLSIHPFANAPLGLDFQYQAYATFDDGNVLDVTSQTTWESDDPSVVTISNILSNAGKAIAHGEGETKIIATISGVSISSIFKSAPAQLKSLTIPGPESLAKGLKNHYSLIGLYTDGKTRDLSDLAVWTVTGNSQISNIPGLSGLLQALGIGSSKITASFGGMTATTSISVTPAKLNSISISPQSQFIGKGLKKNYTAIGLFSDGTKKDITSEVTWIVDSRNDGVYDTIIGEISNLPDSKGYFSSSSEGYAIISANLDGITGSTGVTVTKAELISISIGAPVSIANGLNGKITAIGTFSDGTTKDITAEAVFTTVGNLFINQITGFFSTLAAERAQITATLAGKSVTTTISVTQAELTSISISPRGEIISKGLTKELTATGFYTDGSKSDITDLVSWHVISLSGSITKSSDKVFFHAGNIGLAEVTASLNGVFTSTTLIISPATLVSISIEAPKTLSNGLSTQLRAIGTYTDNSTHDITSVVTWTDSGNATITNDLFSSGWFKSKGEESSKITATYKGITSSVTINVVPAEITSLQFSVSNLQIAKGTTKKIGITGSFTDGTTQDLSSQISFIADSDGDGLDDQAVISISNSPSTKGEITSILTGSATVTATINGRSIASKVFVTQAELVSISLGTAKSIANGLSLQLSAIGTYTDNSVQDITKDVVWRTMGNGSIANNFLNAGKISTFGEGILSVSASLNGISSNVNITILPAEIRSLSLSSANLVLSKGTKHKVKVNGHFSDGSVSDISSDASFMIDSNGDGLDDQFIAGVSNSDVTKGEIIGNGMGSATLKVSVKNLSITSSITIKSADLVSITVTPGEEEIAKGLSIQYNATGFYTDGSSQDLTNSVSWDTSIFNETSLTPLPVALIGGILALPIANISNTSGTKGKLTSSLVGNINVFASLNGLMGSAKVKIGNAALVQISVSSQNNTTSKGLNESFQATGIYSDGTTQNVTGIVTWKADANGDGLDDSNVIAISNNSLSMGSAKAMGVGYVSITAMLGNLSGSKDYTVQQAVISSINVQSVNDSRPKGLSEKITAIAVYTDGTTKDITSSVTWIADSNGDGKNDTNVASISNSPESIGTVTTTSTGTVRIIGTFGSFTASKTITVQPASVVSVAISPTTANVAKGFVRQFSASGTYTDGTVQDLTANATWISDSNGDGVDDSIAASISNIGGKKGLLTGINSGNSNVKVVFNGVSSSLTAVSVLQSNTIVIGSEPKFQVEELSSKDNPFTFQSNRTINIQAVVVDQNGSPISSALVEFLSADGKSLLFSQISGADGKIIGSFVVNYADTSVLATLVINGTSSSQITIPISRDLGGDMRLVVNILGIQVTNMGSGSNSIVDSDKDGVPDSKDAFPSDPNKAFTIRIPSTGYNTLTFEDKYPSVGDKDLNDYVLYVVNEEDLNAKGEIVEIRTRYQHVARGAISNTHTLKLQIPASISVSRFTTTIYDGNNSQKKKVDLVNPGSKTFSLFDDLDSSDTLPWQWWGLVYRPVYNVYDCPLGINCFLPGYIAKTTIKFTTPVRRDVLGSSPYDIYASVSTGKDIHLPGKYLVNGKDPYLDSTGFPWAILVPGDFKWPKLQILPAATIYNSYPNFGTWATSKGTKNTDWYKNYDGSKVYTDASPSSIITDK
jgi:LruC domain-containing protein